MLSSLLKYIFITVIYLFIFGVIRLIYLDIKSIGAKGGHSGDSPYLKLVNRRERLGFKVEETYILGGNVELGRSGRNGIILNDPYISNKHTRFVLRNGKYYIEDMGSTNGTFVNSAQINNEAVALNNGDRIHIGQLDFLFVDSGT
ncbi:MAG: FHA domain-containing protein [Clostridia bacterium]|nr:FHA domain-containing protein [Clostridia bacterium]